MNRLVIDSKTGSIQLNETELHFVNGIDIHMTNDDYIRVKLDIDVDELSADIEFDDEYNGLIKWKNPLSEQKKQGSRKRNKFIRFVQALYLLYEAI